MKIEALDRLVDNLIWTREVLSHYLREISQESEKVENQNLKESLNAYEGFLRQIILDIGALLNMIQLDRMVDDPQFKPQNKLNIHEGNGNDFLRSGSN